MERQGDRTRRRQPEGHALFEELRALLYRLLEGHPSRPGLHAAAVAAYCHWRESLAPPPTRTALNDVPDTFAAE